MGQGDIWSPPCTIMLSWRRCLTNISGNWTWFIPTATTGTFIISLFSILIGSCSFSFMRYSSRMNGWRFKVIQNHLFWHPMECKCAASYLWHWYASVDGVWLFIWRHTFKIVAMTSFRAGMCCHLVSAHAASVRHISRSGNCNNSILWLLGIGR